MSLGQGGLGRGRGGGGRGGGNDQTHDARKPTQEEIDACTHIKAKRYDTKEYKLFSAAERAKHWQLLNPSRTPIGVERRLIGGRRTAKDRRRDYERERKATPSTISDTSTKRAKYEEID